MHRKSDGLPVSRAQLLKLVLLFVLTAGIALGNLSPDLLTLDLVGLLGHPQQSVERAYGWPLRWYWRSAYLFQRGAVYYPQSLRGFWHSLRAAPKSPVLRYDGQAIALNVAIWIAMAVAALGTSQTVSHRFQLPRIRRPHVVTLIVLTIISALIVLANLSVDVSAREGPRQCSYGWPSIWRRWIFTLALHGQWDYSVARLSGNIATSVLILALAGFACESLLRCYPIRPRWSLQTMLVAFALAGLFCARCVELRNRADVQDDLIERLHETSVYVERSGPEWLEVLGAGRYRRRIAGAKAGFNCIASKTENNAVTLRRLARLPSLQFLDLRAYKYRGPFDFTPDMAKEFDKFRQLRILNMDLNNNDDRNQILTHAWLNGVAKLTRLERLRLRIRAESSGDLGFLANSSNLKSLTLTIDGLGDESDPEHTEPGNRENAAASFSLAYLPVLSNLEALDLHDVVLDGSTLGHLARFPRLRSLNLCWTSLADTDLSNLASLQSLEELAIDGDAATAAAFEVLISLQRLKAVHIAPSEYDDDERSASFALDDGHEFGVLPAQVGRLRRALLALRNSNPGIVIDGGYHQFEEKGNFEPPWARGDRGLDLFVQRWIEER